MRARRRRRKAAMAASWWGCIDSEAAAASSSPKRRGAEKTRNAQGSDGATASSASAAPLFVPPPAPPPPPPHTLGSSVSELLQELPSLLPCLLEPRGIRRRSRTPCACGGGSGRPKAAAKARPSGESAASGARGCTASHESWVMVKMIRARRHACRWEARRKSNGRGMAVSTCNSCSEQRGEAASMSRGRRGEESAGSSAISACR